jgi:PhoPQ-activated pathogenicity-related protein
VIDTLNFRAQMDYQIETWGEFSEQIADYTRKGLVRANGEEETPRETALRTMMDPWTYREQITIPKLVINGTNDRYWVVDAAKNYFPDLVGPKYVLQIPNAGHGLEGGHDKVVASIAALFRRVASGAELPNIEWTLEENEQGERRIVVSSNPPAHAAMLWTAVSETKDFREVKWTGRSFGGRNGTFETSIPEPRPGQGIAAFGELRFMDRTIDPPIQYSLTTTVTRFPARTEGE